MMSNQDMQDWLDRKIEQPADARAPERIWRGIDRRVNEPVSGDSPLPERHVRNIVEYVRADRLAAMEAENRKLRDHLRKYRDDLCEGFCADLPDGYHLPEMDIDCRGCRARAALSYPGDPYPVPDASAEEAVMQEFSGGGVFFSSASPAIRHLRRAIATAQNDDISEAGTEKRQRHVHRIAAMEEAASLLADVQERVEIAEEGLTAAYLAGHERGKYASAVPYAVVRSVEDVRETLALWRIETREALS